MIKEKISELIEKVLEKQGMPKAMVKVNLDHPEDPHLGDYSTNVAMLLAKQLGTIAKDPLTLAQKLSDELNAEISNSKNEHIEKTEAAKPGFINFFLSKKFFADSINEVLEKTAWYGKNTRLWNKKIIIEYTDPNPFKPFHIGHLMSNAIGEALSRLLEFQDAKIFRANYGGDVGLHVARAVWGMMEMKGELHKGLPEQEQINFIGKAYTFGSEQYEKDDKVKDAIDIINKKIYEASDTELNDLYFWGKEISLKHFEDIYKVLGSRFDYQFFESEMVHEGLEIVKAGIERDIFVKSEGAIIFPGEKYGLHNRVFITSKGLPTYEAKELGLTKKKFEFHDFNQSIIITANEQDGFYKVIKKTLELLFPEIAARTHHKSHGMMRFSSGKMSSRTGNVVTGESLISDIEAMVEEKIKDRGFGDREKKNVAEKVAVAAIKYSILKQSVGKDIIFDPEKSISFEGDSGPYLQYAYVRAKSILAKAKEEGIEGKVMSPDGDLADFEKNIYKFPEIVERAATDYAPNYIATYLTKLAGEFNSYYASNKIVDPKDPHSAHKVALTEALTWVLKNGLHLLGIETPEHM